ncbi:DUF4352 domain-containing protein [Enterococcus larvae]|uniref:DUF4352 domain-containing protein n=1 Tax=Enterococcus larvae TaxID=2794352 RepID=UPI003F3525F6
MKKFICLVGLVLMVGCSDITDNKKTSQSTNDTSASAEAAKRKIIDEANKRAETKQSKENELPDDVSDIINLLESNFEDSATVSYDKTNQRFEMVISDSSFSETVKRAKNNDDFGKKEWSEFVEAFSGLSNTIAESSSNYSLSISESKAPYNILLLLENGKVTHDAVSYRNESSDSSNSEEKKSGPSIGESVLFTSDNERFELSIDSVSKVLSDDHYELTGAFFAKVDFTIKNLGSDPLSFTSHDLEFYDSDDFKSKMINKDYFGETIQPGKSIRGVAYFDVATDGSNYEVFFADNFWKGAY